MAKKWFYINSSLDRYGASSSVVWACSGSLTGPLQLVSNTIYGTFENPYVEYYYNRNSNKKIFHGFYNIDSSTPLPGTGSFSTMQGGRLLCSIDGTTPVSTSANHSRYYYDFTYDVYENTKISGKYKLKNVLSSPLMSGVSIPINVNINGVLYIELFTNLLSSEPTTTYNIKGTIYNSNLSYVDINTSSTTSQPILDFGTKEQDVPTFFKEWLETNADIIYPYNYIIRSYDGDTILGEINNAPPIIKVELYTIDIHKTLTMTGTNNKEYSLSWDTITPDGTIFLGLSNDKNSSRALIPVNTTTNVTWYTDITLYESYGKYRPPGTTFDINLYQNTSEGNRVDKTNYLTQVGTISGALRSSTSINDLVITYESKSIPNFNYVYIPIFNRYYFVDDITSENYSLWTLALSVDPLMTYKEAILNCNGFVDRCESDFNANIIDKKRVVEEGNTIEVNTVTNELFTNTSGTYIMTALLVGFDNI